MGLQKRLSCVHSYPSTKKDGYVKNAFIFTIGGLWLSFGSLQAGECAALCDYLNAAAQPDCLSLCAKNLEAGGQKACITHCGITFMSQVFPSCNLSKNDSQNNNSYLIQTCYSAYNNHIASRAQFKAINGYNKCIKRCRIQYPTQKPAAHPLSV